MKNHVSSLTLIIVILIGINSCNQKTETQNEPTVLDAFNILSKGEFIDLSHTFNPDIPHWHGFPKEERQVLYSHDEGQGSLGTGFLAEQYCIVGQWGTHVDPPNHFVKGGRSIDQITLQEMILPLMIIDVHKKVEKNNDYVLTIDDLKEWESRNGIIPKNSFVAMRTDWSKRWPDASRFANKDQEGISHYPGWSIEALKFLFEERNITAIGHEPTDTDPGVVTSKGDYSNELYVLSSDHYQIEMLTNLDLVPEYGSMIIVSFPKPLNGSGFPARVIAIIPNPHS